MKDVLVEVGILSTRVHVHFLNLIEKIQCVVKGQQCQRNSMKESEPVEVILAIVEFS